MSSEQNNWNIDGIQFSILSEKEIILVLAYIQLLQNYLYHIK